MKRYNTPHRHRVIKTRLTEEEYADYQETMANAFVGVGITITVREDGQGFDIVQVLDGRGRKDMVESVLSRVKK